MNNFKIKKYFNTSIILVLFTLFISVSIFAQTKPVSVHYKGNDYVVGHDVVCFIVKEKHYNDELLKKFEELNYEIALTLIKYRFVFLRTDGKSDILEHYYKFEKEEYVEAVIPYEAGSYDWVPNDPRYSNQWHLPKINIPSAWNHTTGDTNLKIGVLDSGIPTYPNGNLFHEDLQNANRISGQDVSGSGGLVDAYNHGTHVAGIIGAETNNGIGVASVCFNSKLFMSKISHSGSIFPADAYQGFLVALQQGCKIINMSFGLSETPAVVATFNTIMQLAQDSNVLVVAAAGNDNINVNRYPAKLANNFPSNLMVVAATNANDQKASFSNYGNEISIAAPGDNIYSTTINNNYGNMSGTSMATPIVAGVAGLVKSKFPNYNVAQLKAHLEVTADDLGTPGKDIYFGNGRINAYKAVRTLRVPEYYPTLQDALNAVVHNDEIIVVSSGTHTLNSNVVIGTNMSLSIGPSVSVTINGNLTVDGVLKASDGVILSCNGWTTVNGLLTAEKGSILNFNWGIVINGTLQSLGVLNAYNNINIPASNSMVINGTLDGGCTNYNFGYNSTCWVAGTILQGGYNTFQGNGVAGSWNGIVMQYVNNRSIVDLYIKDADIGIKFYNANHGTFRGNKIVNCNTGLRYLNSSNGSLIWHNGFYLNETDIYGDYNSVPYLGGIHSSTGGENAFKNNNSVTTLYPIWSDNTSQKILANWNYFQINFLSCPNVETIYFIYYDPMPSLNITRKDGLFVEVVTPPQLKKSVLSKDGE